MAAPSVTNALIEWGVATETFRGQAECGDCYVIQPSKEGVLVAAVDGVGHGRAAARAATIAAETLGRFADEALLSLLQRCHRILRGTRGVVFSLASLSSVDNRMTWLGVGNVEGMLLRADPRVIPTQESLVLRGGVVGVKLALPYATTIPIMPGDTLLFATDGISPEFLQDLNLRDPPQPVADRVLSRYWLGRDDALVLVVRYRGRSRLPTRTAERPSTEADTDAHVRRSAGGSQG